MPTNMGDYERGNFASNADLWRRREGWEEWQTREAFDRAMKRMARERKNAMTSDLVALGTMGLGLGLTGPIAGALGTTPGMVRAITPSIAQFGGSLAGRGESPSGAVMGVGGLVSGLQTAADYQRLLDELTNASYKGRGLMGPYPSELR